MLLHRLVLTDFGVYGGRNEFDLSVEEGRPVVLFGGKNGAGKTTLFESVPLCLYGRDSMEPRPTKKQYRDRIRRMFHVYRGTSRRAEEASVSLEFLYHTGGTTTSCRITRMWHNDADVTESLSVSKKGQADDGYTALDGTEQQAWQAFVDRLFPRSITKLFFLDGEKIHEIAEMGGEGSHIKSSFDALLGIDVVEQLYDDIGLHMLRNSGGDTGKIEADLEAKREDKRRAEEKMAEYAEKAARLTKEISGLRVQAESDEEKFLKLGGRFASDRAGLLGERASLESRRDDIGRRIKEACAGPLPLLLVPRQLEKVRERLVQDRLCSADAAKREVQLEAYRRLGDAVKRGIAKYDGGIRDDVSGVLERAQKRLLREATGPAKPAYNFSMRDMERMIRYIDDVKGYDMSGVRGLSREYDEIQDRLEKVKSALDASPQEDEISPILSRITRANREIGEMENGLQRLEDLAAQERSMISMLNVQMRQCLAGRKLDKRRLAGLEIAPSVQDALGEYSRRLRMRKVKQLEANIMDSLRMLFHKKCLVEDIRIDPETFGITLYREGGETLDRDTMSNGEIQTYVTGIAWGLAKTSGRALPFMIDTPLARLDEDHRMNVLEGFYPHASHQIIILSTNSEIVGQYHEKIEPYLARSMLARYDAASGRAVTEEGYFGMEARKREVG